MRIAIIGSGQSWYADDLRRAASERHTIEAFEYGELESEVGDRGISLSGRGVNLREFDAALIRSMPPASLEQVVFRMDGLAQLSGQGVRVVNYPRAIEVAVDKYLATARLRQAGLLVPETIVCQSVAHAMKGFASLGGDVVVKPIFGGEGRGIVRVSDEAIAERTFKALGQIGSVLYLQKFIPHEGADLRLLTLGDKVLGMCRRNVNDWRTNISRGATGEPLRVTDELAELALRAAAAVGAEIAGVDLLPGRDGRLYALEVNAVPGWRALAKVTQTDVATEVLNLLGNR